MTVYKTPFLVGFTRILGSVAMVSFGCLMLVGLFKLSFDIFIPAFEAAMATVILGVMSTIFILLCIINLADEIYGCFVEVDLSDTQFLIFRPFMAPQQIDYHDLRHIKVIRAQVFGYYRPVGLKYFLNSDVGRRGHTVTLPLLPVDQAEEIQDKFQVDERFFNFSVSMKHV